MKDIFSTDDFKKIEAAVSEAEKSTSGEIVPMIVAASSGYPSVQYRTALMGLFAATAVAIFFHYYRPFALEFWATFVLQAAGLVIGWLVGKVPMVIRFVLGQEWLAEEVHETALAAFLENGLHGTRDRTGILIFISLLERRVEILADKGINEKVGKNFWQEEVSLITSGIRGGKAGEALSAVILDIGQKLSLHFPKRSDDKNELSNQVRTDL